MSDKVFDAKYNGGLPAAPVQVSFGAASRPAESTKDKANALGELKKLYEADIITAEEYEEKRRKIFDSI